MGLSAGAWIDVVKDGAQVASSAHGHGPACSTLRKQVAFELGISEVTVKLHRSNVMRKMVATSIGDLIRTWESLPVSVRDACAA